MPDKVVIFCGPRAGYGFTPVPPLTNSAPEKNAFRIAEGAYGKKIEVHVISICSPMQKRELSRITTDQRYHHVVLLPFIYKLFYSRIFKNRFIDGLIKKLTYAYNLFSFVYLVKALKVIKEIEPSVLIINDLAQYIHFIKKNLPEQKLGLFLRSEVGGSRRYLNELDFIIANSEGFKTYANQLVGNRFVRTYVIPNSLDMSFCKKKQYQNMDKIGYVLIYCGRVVPVKGVMELVQAFNHLTLEMNDVKLLILGGGYGKEDLTSYEEEIWHYVKKNTLSVEFCGQVPHEVLPEYYTKADLAVFPSIWLESFGMVALEAMRCGLPVVASRRPGFKELVEHDETGLLVNDPTDIEELSRAIKILLLDPEKLHKMGRKAYQRSLAYTPEKANNQFLQIIKKELFK